MSKSMVNSENIQAARRREQVLDLRAAGMTYRQIGEALGVTKQRAHQLAKQEFDKCRETNAARADEITQLTLRRLNELIATYRDKALKGDEKAADLLLRVIDRQMRLVGAEAPKQFEVGRIGDLTPAEALERAERMGIPAPPEIPDVGDFNGE